MKATRSKLLSSCTAAAILLAAAGGISGGPFAKAEKQGPQPAEGRFTLYALDHRHNIFDFRTRSHGWSRQFDEGLREFVGDLLFTGRELSVLQSDRVTGTFLDLGRDAQPDTEFSPFYALRVHKRRFRILQFPFHDHDLPFTGVDSVAFFNSNREPVPATRVNLGHTYLLRVFHRTRVADERVFALRTLDFTPGVKVTILWRELPVAERG